jgi:hypothetical protein
MVQAQILPNPERRGRRDPPFINLICTLWGVFLFVTPVTMVGSYSTLWNGIAAVPGWEKDRDQETGS